MIFIALSESSCHACPLVIVTVPIPSIIPRLLPRFQCSTGSSLGTRLPHAHSMTYLHVYAMPQAHKDSVHEYNILWFATLTSYS